MDKNDLSAALQEKISGLGKFLIFNNDEFKNEAWRSLKDRLDASKPEETIDSIVGSLLRVYALPYNCKNRAVIQAIKEVYPNLSKAYPRIAELYPDLVKN